jgi:hypothetical protein
MKNLIFIGGTGRCGTNILKELFSFHQSVYTLPFEYRILVDPDGIFDFYNAYQTWTPYMADKKIKRLRDFLRSVEKSPSFIHRSLSGFISFFGIFPVAPKKYYKWELEKWIPNFKYISECFLNQVTAFSYDAIYPGSESYKDPYIIHGNPKTKDELRTIVRSYMYDILHGLLSHHNKEYFVEDNTWNILFAKEIHEIFPKSKLIHIYRDPRDVTVSFTKQRWAPNELHKATMYYKSLMWQWFKIKKQLNPSSYIEVKFEDLIDNPLEIMDYLCKSCNMGVIYHTKTIGEYTKKLYPKSHIGRWEKDISVPDQQSLDSSLSFYIKELGYR